VVDFGEMGCDGGRWVELVQDPVVGFGSSRLLLPETVFSYEILWSFESSVIKGCDLGILELSFKQKHWDNRTT
jgi:hypothetical protein